MRFILFHLLRAYVAIEQSRVVRWFLNKRPDVIIEQLPRDDDSVPTVHREPEVFLDGDLKAAYTPVGKTLRRVAQNDEGELVFIHKRSKSERKALKRANRRHGRRAEA